jgi:PIN domain nuclease of toxin-antitoxin system
VILLDTHVLLWLDQNSDRLGEHARRRTKAAFEESGVAVSAITFWEVAMLAAKGRISTSLDIARWREDLISAGLVEFVVDGATGIQATQLQGLQGDPADRIILATAVRKGAALLTADERLLSWRGTLERLDARR